MFRPIVSFQDTFFNLLQEKRMKRCNEQLRPQFTHWWRQCVLLISSNHEAKTKQEKNWPENNNNNNNKMDWTIDVGG